MGKMCTNHTWESTTAHGWFRCRELVDFNSKTGKSTLCSAVALCPACLGYVLPGVPSVFCSAHESCQITDFPVYEQSVSQVGTDPSYEQASMF